MAFFLLFNQYLLLKMKFLIKQINYPHARPLLKDTQTSMNLHVSNLKKRNDDLKISKKVEAILYEFDLIEMKAA